MSDEDLLARRDRITRIVRLAKRVGYSLLLLAIVAFSAAAVSDFPGVLVTVTAVALIGACVVLPVPIVLGYGLRAAAREDRDAAARHVVDRPMDGER